MLAQLCDLALLSVLDPSLLNKTKENLNLALEQEGQDLPQYWQRSVDFITASDAVLARYFDNPDRWLTSLVQKNGKVAWGRMLIESIVAYCVRDNADVWVGLMTLANNK